MTVSSRRLRSFAVAAGVAVLIGGLVGSLLRSRISHFWRCNSGTPGLPAWSADGTTIAYGQPTACGTRLAALDLPSHAVRPLTNGSDDGLPAWSASSRTLLFVDGSDVSRVELPVGRSHVVARGVDEFGASLSPNGDSVAYTHGFMGSPFDGGDSRTTVYVVSSAGGKARRLLGHDINGGRPAWSPNGRALVVVGYEGVYVVPSAGGPAHRILKRSFSTPGFPSWSRDGQIAFIDDGEVDVMSDRGGRVTRLARCDCYTQTDGVSWSPDGRRLVFSTSYGVFVIRSDGTGLHALVRYRHKA